MKPMLHFIDVEVDKGWFAIEEKLPNGVAVGPADGGAGNEGLDIETSIRIRKVSQAAG